MDDATFDQSPGTRLARWMRPTPAELVGLAILLLGAMTASGIWWFQAAQRPAPFVNEAGAIGAAVGADVVGGTEGVSGGGRGDGGAGSADAAGVHLLPGQVDVVEGDVVTPPMTVHVTGAVRRPGLVRVAAGSRVGDGVDAAGGLRGDAVSAGINLARLLADGEQVHVPAAGDTVVVGGREASAGTPSSPGVATDGRVDLNRATREELETLPGVGPARADAIVAYREEHGPFAVPGDLRGVRGIGEATFQTLADLVTVG